MVSEVCEPTLDLEALERPAFSRSQEPTDQGPTPEGQRDRQEQKGRKGPKGELNAVHAAACFGATPDCHPPTNCLSPLAVPFSCTFAVP